MIALEVQSRSPKSGTKILTTAASVPIGQRGLVHIWGRNDTSVEQKLGIRWVVRDPDGITVEDYADWQFGNTDPGKDHEFIGGRFDLEKEGTYTIAVNLFMNESSPVRVDSYEGALCTTTLEVPPEFELIQDTIYPYAYVYDGDAEVTTVIFRSDPFSPSAWQAEQLADKMKEELEKDGRRVLKLKVYVDTSPLLWSDFRLEIETTPAPVAAVGIAWWAIIAIILAVIGLVRVITISVTSIVRSFKHEPISEEIKQTWSRDALINVTHDFEDKLGRSQTPMAELETWSDGELRDYVDAMAEEIAPAGPSWLPWVIGGAAAVVGIGAVFALSGRRR